MFLDWQHAQSGMLGHAGLGRTGSHGHGADGAGALDDRRGAISERPPGAGSVVRDAAVRQYMVAATLDSGFSRFVSMILKVRCRQISGRREILCV